MSHPPIPLTVLSGFLGSGKTTLLSHVLTHPGGRRIAALVNDFGALNIDNEIIAGRHGSQINLANGCVCCSLGDDLTRALVDTLAQDPLPDHIIIEASGVADPARIAAFASVDRALRLDSILCCIDLSAYDAHRSNHHLADTLARQIEAAHIFLLTKRDLIDEPSFNAFCDRFPQDRPRLIATHGEIDTDLILGLANDEVKMCKAPPDHHFVSFSGHIPQMTPDIVQQHLGQLTPHLIRAKGITADAQGPYIFHFAGSRFSIERQQNLRASGHFAIIGDKELCLEGTLFAPSAAQAKKQ